MQSWIKAAALAAISATGSIAPAAAGQSGYGVWSAPDFGVRSSDRWQPQIQQNSADMPPTTPQWRAVSPSKPATASGGAQPLISPVAPPVVMIKGGYEPGTVVVDTRARTLYLVQEADIALAYPIGVGREGFEWSGEETISRIADWPDWYPPAEMRQRQRGLPVRMTGGLRNPLGAKALYLGSTLYRIHGTDAPKTIGTAQSSGCIRCSTSTSSIWRAGSASAQKSSWWKQPRRILWSPKCRHRGLRVLFQLKHVSTSIDRRANASASKEKAGAGRKPPRLDTALKRNCASSCSSRATPLVSGRKLFRCDACRFKELANLNDFVLGQGVVHMREGHLVTVQRDADAIAGLVLDFGAKLLQHMFDFLEIDVRRDRMGEQLREHFTMLMVHLRPLRLAAR